jgi:hypothetical protein
MPLARSIIPLKKLPDKIDAEKESTHVQTSPLKP